MQHDQRGGRANIKLDMKSQGGLALLHNLQNRLIRVIVISFSSLVDTFSEITMFKTVYTHKSISSRR